MKIPRERLDLLSNVEATQWFQAKEKELRGVIVSRARAYHARMLEVGLEETDLEQALFFAAVADLESLREQQAPYFSERKAQEKARRQENIALNRERGRQQHEEAVQKAEAEGRDTNAERKKQFWKTRLQEGIAAAHYNPDPLPVPETREERIVNNQLRSFGSIVHVNTGNINSRIVKKPPPRYRE